MGARVAVAAAIIASMLTWMVHSQQAGAFPNASDESAFASFTLEACRLTPGTTLPINGKFVCPDAMYTTGNLGKSWNELDLVPHRLTMALGSQPGATTDYKVSLAADGVTNGKVGYDVLSAPVVNAAKSHASCAVTSGATQTSGTNANPFGGGTDTVIYRDVTIHQDKNTTCVIDWYQRLALTSHQYSGSSLQSYMFSAANFSGGKKTLSIPVNQIEPQSLSADMSASQTQDYVWDITKSTNPSAVHFDDSCAPGNRTSPSIEVKVSWQRLPAAPGAITIISHVSATNPSARAITTTVTDKIYAGATQTTQLHPTEAASSPTHLTKTVVVPAFTTMPVIHFIGTLPAGTATSFNAVATGSYTDDVTGVPITQTTTATAAATAAVATHIGTNATATIVDTETVSPGFHFAVTGTTGTVGSFVGGYTLNTPIVGPLVWNSPLLTGDGSVTFTKTITADGAKVVTAADNKELNDTATLLGSGGFTASASAAVSLTSGAMLNVGVHKTMQGGVSGTQNFVFDVYAGSNPGGAAAGLTKVGTIPLSITPPNLTAQGSIDVAATRNNNTFTIVERPAANWASQPNQVIAINLPNCAGFAEFDNTFGLATAKVQKQTVPAGNEHGWTFTLSGPGTPAGGEKVTTTGAGYVNFTTPLQAGNYSITEADRAGFDFTSSSGDCSFSVVYPDDADHAFACTYTNTQRGALEVTKHVDWNGVTPDGSAFVICITGPTYPAPALGNGGCKSVGASGGKLTWDNLLAGHYVVAENDPGSSWVVSGGDGATATVSSGEKTTAASITNTRQLGSLQVTKSVDWNGVTPDQSKTFEICLTGPSYPITPNCKTADFDGATLTWSNLIPGNYVATETNPGSSWTAAGNPTPAVTVPTDGSRASVVHVITNTRKHGSLQVTKNVNWNGVTPDQSKTFEICLTGPSYPTTPNCKTADFDGGTLSWSNLIPGDYVATETNPGSSWTVAGSPTSAITVPADGSSASVVPVITNTRKLGSLKVTKAVDWNGVTPVAGQEFVICIKGPSFPSDADCKTFTSPNGLVQTWTGLIPGSYSITEPGLPAQWIRSGDESAIVPTDGGQATAGVTNTHKLGSLKVTKAVDWNGVTPVAGQEFVICVNGPSFPSAADCKTFTAPDGLVQTWTGLIPGAYSITEPGLAVQWIRGGDNAATVPDTGGQGTAVVTNTRKLGSLKVTKAVDWNGVTPVAGEEFEICVKGPSFPSDPDCKTFTSPDGLVQTWTGLIPGAYNISEPGLAAAWVRSGDAAATVADDGGQATAAVSNTRKLGSLQVTKSVEWNGVSPDPSETFEICLTGPSYPTTPNCKATDFDGGTLTWSNLIPGDYVATETNPGSFWTVAGNPAPAVTVPSDGSTASVVSVITNTRKHGSLQVTKNVNWNGVTPDDDQTFDICITGPSYPTTPNCKAADFDGGTLTWSNLIPGAYVATEASPGSTWTVTGSPTAAVTVPADGTTAEFVPEITNTRKLGSLKVAKAVDWNGVTPVAGQEFAICIKGPSFPTDAGCKTFTAPDGLVQTWTGLIPGSYSISEPGLGGEWVLSGDESATVPANGGQATADVTNTRKLGSLDVTKVVDWNGVTPNPNRTFEICIFGPSYPEPTAANGGCQNADFNGAKLVWDDLVPGEYEAVETDPGSQWLVDGASSTIAVPIDGTRSDDHAVITNTRKHGSLEVTKVVDWNGVTPVAGQTFSICIAGPSYPVAAPSNGACKTIGYQGGVLTWTDLLPGEYVVSEVDPGIDWKVEVTGSPVTVPINGGKAAATVTNTRKAVEVLGQELARTGGESTVALGLGAVVVVLVAARRVARRLNPM